MKKYSSLIFRELKLGRKAYIGSFILIIVFALLMLLSMFVSGGQYVKNGESMDVFAICLSYMFAALTAGCIAGDNGVLKSDMASGWRTYSFALPVTALEKTVAKYIVKLAAIIIGAVLTFIGSMLIHTVGGSNMPSAVMFCYFICLDLFLIIDIVYQAVVLRADDMKSFKKLGAIAGGIGTVILLALEFIPSGVSDSEFETFMTEVETASSPVILNKYIGFVTIPDAAGIIGIVLTVVILIAGFLVTLKNHKRREV